MAGFYFAKVRFWVKTKKNMCHTTTNFFHSVWCYMALVCIDTIEVIMGDTSAIAYSASALKRIGQIMMERGQLDNGEGVTLLGTDLLKSPNLCLQSKVTLPTCFVMKYCWLIMFIDVERSKKDGPMFEYRQHETHLFSLADAGSFVTYSVHQR